MFRRLVVITACVLAAASCQKESQVDKATREGILIVGNTNEPKGLDPHIVSGVLEANILRTLFEGLVNADPKDDMGTPPGAALSVTPDATATVWTVTLRPDGRWSDGTPVTAHDFAFAYQRLLSPKLGAQYVDMLYFLKGAEDFNKGRTTDFSTVGVEVIDDDTFKLTLRGPTPYFPQVLKHYTWGPVPSHVVRRFGEIDQRGNPWSKAENIVGNGPYRLKSWRRNDHIEVERNPYYWGAKDVTLNGVRFLPITNSYTEARMFRDGQLHITFSASPEIVDLMKKEQPDELRQEPYLGTAFFRLNTTRKPLDDARVRQALSYAIDRDAICTNILRGYKPAYAITPPMSSYQPPRVAIYDPDKARQLLAEAGFPGGKGFPRLKILLASKETATTISQAVQAMLSDNLGIGVDIDYKEWTAYLDATQKLEYDISWGGWIGDFVDPLTFLEMWMPGNGNNNTGWSNPTFTETIKTSLQEMDPKRRMVELQEAERIVATEAPFIPLAWQASNYLISPSVEGWYPLLLNTHPYEHLRLVPRH